MAITVFLVDDHRIFLDSLKVFLELEKDISVIGMAYDGRSALLGISELAPDVVIMDITMPELNGIDAVTNILLEKPNTRVIMLSGYSDVEYVHRSLQAGAMGYLLKDTSGMELALAVRAVFNGKRYLSLEIPKLVLADYMKQSNSPLEKLSLREREVLQLLVEGNNSASIAEKLGLSPKTVDTYRSRLMSKLGVKDLPSLMRIAIKHGLTPL
jgi:DNA-binding NarL/FixJ family response regulator